MKHTTNKTVLALAVVALTTTSLPALANSVDVRVIGAISPTACTVNVGGNGTIDYGVIPPSTLSKTDYTVLPTRTLNLSISCDAPAKVALTTINGRPGSAAGAPEGAGGYGVAPVVLFDGEFTSSRVAGLGFDGDDDDKIGGYSMRFRNDASVADDTPVRNIYAQIVNETWLTGGAIFHATQPLMSSWANSTTLAPVEFRNLSAEIMVSTYINKTESLDMNKPINLDGLVTFELKYL